MLGPSAHGAMQQSIIYYESAQRTVRGTNFIMIHYLVLQALRTINTMTMLCFTAPRSAPFLLPSAHRLWYKMGSVPVDMRTVCGTKSGDFSVQA